MNQHQHYTSVYVTKDYDMFETIDGNRMINQLHVNKLVQSMTDKQLVTPIIVNEKMQIIDGQHRFTAISKLELSIYYTICEGYGLLDVHRLNERSHNWTIKDFLDGYSTFAEKDPAYEDYIILKNFIYDHKITPAMGIFLTKGEMNDFKALTDFKNGYFKIVELSSAELFLHQLEDFHSYFSEQYKTSSFMKAFRIFSSSPKYNHDNMVKKLEYMNGYLESKSSIAQYLDLMSTIYNTRLGDKYRIHFKGEKELILT